MNEGIGATGMHADDDTGKGTVAIGKGEIEAQVLAANGDGFGEGWHRASPFYGSLSSFTTSRSTSLWRFRSSLAADPKRIMSDLYNAPDGVVQG